MNVFRVSKLKIFNTDQRNMGLCGLKSFTKTKCVIKKCHKRSHRVECLIRLVRFLLKGLKVILKPTKSQTIKLLPKYTLEQIRLNHKIKVTVK